MEKEFGIKGVGKIDIGARKGLKKSRRKIVVMELKDWETKQRIMSVKSKLGERKIYIEHDLTREEREVQKILIEKAREERREGRKVKVGYRKLVIDETQFVWNEQRKMIVEKNG